MAVCRLLQTYSTAIYCARMTSDDRNVQSQALLVSSCCHWLRMFQILSFLFADMFVRLSCYTKLSCKTEIKLHRRESGCRGLEQGSGTVQYAGFEGLCTELERCKLLFLLQAFAGCSTICWGFSDGRSSIMIAPSGVHHDRDNDRWDCCWKLLRRWYSVVISLADLSDMLFIRGGDKVSYKRRPRRLLRRHPKFALKEGFDRLVVCRINPPSDKFC